MTSSRTVRLEHWIAGARLDDPGAHQRLFCLPYAGGGASLFREWPRELAGGLEVYPVQLPGREERWSEAAFHELRGLVTALCEVVAAVADMPFALFGHSMGGLIAFELARELRRQDKPGPFHLFLSGLRAPQMPERHRPIHDLPNPEFLREVGALNGIPEAVLGHAEFMDVLLPTLRADLTLCETYRFHSEPPLECPISAFGGTDDPRVNAAELSGWAAHTKREFRPHFFGGDHFFVNSARSAVLQVLAKEATETLARGSWRHR